MKKNYKILVIDDSKTMYTMISSFLKVEGFTDIEYAANGKIGLEMVKSKEYDLVTLDIDMPVMDGFTTAKEILKIYPDEKILFLSARQGDFYVNKAKEINVCNYLSKPFKPKQLIQVVSNILNQK